jgi:hypothetical protein
MSKRNISLITIISAIALILSLEYQDPLRVGAERNISQFSVLGRYGLYHFTLADWQSVELVMEYVKLSENAIQFAKDLVEFDVENSGRVLTVIFQTAETETEAHFQLNTAHLSVSVESLTPTPLIHLPTFTTNAILESPIFAADTFGFYLTREIPPTTTGFNRSLATLARLMFMDMIEDDELQKTIVEVLEEFLSALSESETAERDYLALYRERVARYSSSGYCKRAHSDTLSILTIDVFVEHFGHYHLIENTEQITREDVYSALGEAMYTLDISFFLFLLDMGSSGDLLRVFSDITLVEEVYGRCIDELTREWLIHLFGDEF